MSSWTGAQRRFGAHPLLSPSEDSTDTKLLHLSSKKMDGTDSGKYYIPLVESSARTPTAQSRSSSHLYNVEYYKHGKSETHPNSQRTRLVRSDEPAPSGGLQLHDLLDKPHQYSVSMSRARSESVDLHRAPQTEHSTWDRSIFQSLLERRASQTSVEPAARGSNAHPNRAHSRIEEPLTDIWTCNSSSALPNRERDRVPRSMVMSAVMKTPDVDRTIPSQLQTSSKRHPGQGSSVSMMSPTYSTRKDARDAFVPISAGHEKRVLKQAMLDNKVTRYRIPIHAPTRHPRTVEAIRSSHSSSGGKRTARTPHIAREVYRTLTSPAVEHSGMTGDNLRWYHGDSVHECYRVQSAPPTGDSKKAPDEIQSPGMPLHRTAQRRRALTSPPRDEEDEKKWVAEWKTDDYHSFDVRLEESNGSLKQTPVGTMTPPDLLENSNLSIASVKPQIQHRTGKRNPSRRNLAPEYSTDTTDHSQFAMGEELTANQSASSSVPLNHSRNSFVRLAARASRENFTHRVSRKQQDTKKYTSHVPYASNRSDVRPQSRNGNNRGVFSAAQSIKEKTIQRCTSHPRPVHRVHGGHLLAREIVEEDELEDSDFFLSSPSCVTRHSESQRPIRTKTSSFSPLSNVPTLSPFQRHEHLTDELEGTDPVHKFQGYRSTTWKEWVASQTEASLQHRNGHQNPSKNNTAVQAQRYAEFVSTDDKSEQQEAVVHVSQRNMRVNGSRHHRAPLQGVRRVNDSCTTVESADEYEVSAEMNEMRALSEFGKRSGNEPSLLRGLRGVLGGSIPEKAPSRRSTSSVHAKLDQVLIPLVYTQEPGPPPPILHTSRYPSITDVSHKFVASEENTYGIPAPPGSADRRGDELTTQNHRSIQLPVSSTPQTKKPGHTTPRSTGRRAENPPVSTSTQAFEMNRTLDAASAAGSLGDRIVFVKNVTRSLVSSPTDPSRGEALSTDHPDDFKGWVSTTQDDRVSRRAAKSDATEIRVVSNSGHNVYSFKEELTDGRPHTMVGEASRPSVSFKTRGAPHPNHAPGTVWKMERKPFRIAEVGKGTQRARKDHGGVRMTKVVRRRPINEKTLQLLRNVTLYDEAEAEDQEGAASRHYSRASRYGKTQAHSDENVHAHRVAKGTVPPGNVSIHPLSLPLVFESIVQNHQSRSSSSQYESFLQSEQGWLSHPRDTRKK